jgi:hypothetical protein
MLKIKMVMICFSAVVAVFSLSCGDPFFLSYQIRKTEQNAPAPEGSKTVNGVTVAAVSDGYRMMYSEYSGFLIYVWNNSEKPVRLETSKVTLKYSGQTKQSIRPKKQFEPMVIEPGEFCDMKVSFELPYEAINVRGITYTVEVEIPVTFPKNESGKSSEVFTFSSHFESR